MSQEKTTQRIRAGLVGVLKIGFAGAIICAFAFALVIFDSPSGEVSEAEADIWAFFASETTKHEDFVRTLQEEGMSPPREYDYHGNRVFFSYDTTRERPRQVMNRFEQAFKRNGVNKYVHGTAREPIHPTHVKDEDTLAQGWVGLSEIWTGGMVPVEVTRNRMAMVGLETPQGAETLDEVLVETGAGKIAVEDMVGAVRVLEANRDERSGQTTITAVWSDENLDLRKFRPDPRTRSEGGAHPIEFQIPTCPRCVRVSRLSGTEQEAGYHTILYRSQSSINEVLRFYENRMQDYGWRSDDSMRGLVALQQRQLAPGAMESEIRAYRRDAMMLTLLIYRDRHDGQTYIQIGTNQ